MADSEEADLATQLAAWSKPSRVHSKDELPHFAKIGKVCKAFLHQNAHAFVARLGDRSLLMTYSGDGTPISTRVNIFASSSSNTILRAGKQSAEYYVLTLFWRPMMWFLVGFRALCWRIRGR